MQACAFKMGALPHDVPRGGFCYDSQQDVQNQGGTEIKKNYMAPSRSQK